VSAFTQTTKKRRLSRTRFTGQKNMRTRAIHKCRSGFDHVGLVLCSFHAAKKQRRKKSVRNKLCPFEIPALLNLSLHLKLPVTSTLCEVLRMEYLKSKMIIPDVVF
jgi:hypothetical protein